MEGPTLSDNTNKDRSRDRFSRVLGRFSVGRSLSLVDNIRRLDSQRSDLTVRWHLVGDRRAGDEPNTDIITTATEKSESRSSWAPELGPRNV